MLEHRDVPDRSNLTGGCNGCPNCNSRLSPRIHAPDSERLSSSSKYHPVLLHGSGVRMTRICVQCQRTIGEKCGRCGTEAAPLHAKGQPPTEVEFRCPFCTHQFSQGEGGETGGMCEPCLDAALRNAREQQNTADEIGIIQSR